MKRGRIKKRKQHNLNNVSHTKGSRCGTAEMKQHLYELRGHHCEKCKQYFDILTYHHIMPVRHGGRVTEENGSLLCHNCHAAYHRKYDFSLNKLYHSKHTIDDYIALYRHQLIENWWDDEE